MTLDLNIIKYLDLNFINMGVGGSRPSHGLNFQRHFYDFD